MKRSFKTFRSLEFLTTVSLLFFIWHESNASPFLMKIPTDWSLVGYIIVAASYLWSRALSKTNRGLTYTSVVTTEFYIFISVYAYLYFSIKNLNPDPLYVAITAILNQANWNISRAWTKKLVRVASAIF